MISKQIIDRPTVPPASTTTMIWEPFSQNPFLHLGPIAGGNHSQPESPGSLLWLAGRTGSSSSLIDRYAIGTLA